MMRSVTILRKIKADETAAMRVKIGVMSSVHDPATGGRVTLLEGERYPANSPVVKAHPWAFEPVGGDSAEAHALMDSIASRSVYVRPNAPDPEAVQRLQAVRDEIASLATPLPTPRGRVDIDKLATKMAERTSRRQALEMAVPALERNVLVGRLRAAEAIGEVEHLAYQQSRELFLKFEAAYLRAKSDFESATVVVNQAERRLVRCQDQTGAALAAIEQLDIKAGFTDQDEADPETGTLVEARSA